MQRAIKVSSCNPPVAAGVAAVAARKYFQKQSMQGTMCRAPLPPASERVRDVKTWQPSAAFGHYLSSSTPLRCLTLLAFAVLPCRYTLQLTCNMKRRIHPLPEAAKDLRSFCHKVKKSFHISFRFLQMRMGLMLCVKKMRCPLQQQHSLHPKLK
jgi:hypothetical protein